MAESIAFRFVADVRSESSSGISVNARLRAGEGDIARGFDVVAVPCAGNGLAYHLMKEDRGTHEAAEEYFSW